MFSFAKLALSNRHEEKLTFAVFNCRSCAAPLTEDNEIANIVKRLHLVCKLFFAKLVEYPSWRALTPSAVSRFPPVRVWSPSAFSTLPTIAASRWGTLYPNTKAVMLANQNGRSRLEIDARYWIIRRHYFSLCSVAYLDGPDLSGHPFRPTSPRLRPAYAGCCFGEGGRFERGNFRDFYTIAYARIVYFNQPILVATGRHRGKYMWRPDRQLP